MTEKTHCTLLGYRVRMTEPRKLTDRIRHSAREKFQRAFGEVLDKQTAQLAEQTEDRHAKLVELLERQRREIDDLHAFVRGLELRMRRDLFFASEVEAAAQSAEFAEEMMPKNRGEMFARMDLDEDGTVTKTEMDIVRKTMRDHRADHGKRWMKRDKSE